MSFYRRYRRYLSLFILFFAVGLGGCGSGGSSGDGGAQVRFVHASSDGLNLTLTWHGNWLLTDLTFQEDTEYFKVLNPTMDIRVVESFSGQEISQFFATFPDGTDSTVIFVNQSDNLETLILTDDLSPPAAANELKLRFLNMAPSAGDVDIYLIPPGFTLENTIALAENIHYKGGTMYLTPNAGVYRVVVTQTGTDTILKETAELNFDPETIRSVILMGDEDAGVPLSLKILMDAN